MQKLCNYLAVGLLIFVVMRPTKVDPPIDLPIPVVIVPAKADIAAVVYESEDTPLPSYVIGAANEIKKLNIAVRLIDDDVETGLGKQPIEIARAIIAGRANGLPALVVMGGGVVLKVMDLPTSKEDIVGEFK